MSAFFMRIFFLGICFTFLYSCTETTEVETDEPQKEEMEDLSDRSIEERAEMEIRSALKASPDEIMSIKIYKENLNEDDIEDALITVNRLDFAMEKAAASDKAAKFAEIAYLGNHNYIFFYDGRLKRISVPLAIPSSPKAELKIEFKNIVTEAYKDILIDYRLTKSIFRDYYHISNGSLDLVFQWKVFDNFGTPTPEANYYQYGEVPGTFSLSRDIIIYQGKIENYDSKADFFKFNPEISKTDKELIRFFYDPKQRKYVTNSKPN